MKIPDAAAHPSRYMGICLSLMLAGFLLTVNGKAFLPANSLPATPTGITQPIPGQIESPMGSQLVFFPIVNHSLGPDSNGELPIWSHSGGPGNQEVDLFRHSFTLDEDLSNANLQIFADTRYEVWLDGSWIGRGPARFSVNLREYDRYDLGTLKSGDHLLAVIVQWAPNNRRSESTTPYLLAHVEGKGSSGKVVTAGTGTQWKARKTDAWKSDSAPVHAWGLIGPTELLDFRRLPEDWMKTNYEDDGWTAAVVKDLSVVDFHPLVVPRLTGFDFEETSPLPFQELPRPSVDPNLIAYRPRSIPVLERVSVPATVIDQGILSPGWRIGELQPGIPVQDLTFLTGSLTTLKIEVLSKTGPPKTNSVLIDNNALQWTKASPNRPDVYGAEISIDRGEHKILFSEVPADGLALALAPLSLEFEKFPFQQGVHAGHRLLLADPVSEPGLIDFTGQEIASLNLSMSVLPAYVVLDLGRTIQGRLRAEVEGPSGAIVDIGWDERLFPGTKRPLPSPGSLHPQWNQADSWVLDGSSRQMETIDIRAGRYILIAAWGNEPVTVKNLQVFEERMPVEQVGSFDTDDPVLEAVWHLGVDTLYANMGDAYSDPWRERGQWWGDAYVVDHANRVAFNNTDLLRRGILFMAAAITDGRPNAMAPNGAGHHMLDYGMLWVQSVADYHERSGDAETLQQVYPKIGEFLGYLGSFRSVDTGLLDIPEGIWAQTTYVDTVGGASRNGQSTAVNSMYFGTLLDAATLAAAAGFPEDALRYQDEAGKIQGAVAKYLFRPAEHRYITSIRNGRPVAPTAHAQAWALAYDLVPDEEIDTVAGSLLNLISMQPQSPEVEIYGTFWILEALGKAGKVQEGLDLIKAYYGHLLDAGATTTWEIYNANKFYTQSLSHGWGSSPTWFLTTYLLGVTQTGKTTWSVRPAFEGVSSASGELALSGAILKSSWRIEDCANSSVTVSAPPGTIGEVILPVSPGMLVSLDGETIWQQERALSDLIRPSTGGLLVNLENGEHQMNITRQCNQGGLK